MLSVQTRDFTPGITLLQFINSFNFVFTNKADICELNRLHKAMQACHSRLIDLINHRAELKREWLVDLYALTDDCAALLERVVILFVVIKAI